MDGNLARLINTDKDLKQVRQIPPDNEIPPDEETPPDN